MRPKTATSKKESPVVEESLFLPATSSSNDEDDKDVYEPSDIGNGINYSSTSFIYL